MTPDLPPELPSVLEQLVAAGRRLTQLGLVRGTSGNLSARAGDHLAITPTGAELQALRAEQIAVLGPDHHQVAGTMLPTSELDLHLLLLEDARVGAVVHTHAPAATAVGLIATELPLIHYDMMALGGPIRVAPYARFGSAKLAAATRAAIEDRSAALLANHGAVACGSDLAAAVAATELLEWLCELYLRASAAGTPRALSAEQGREVVDEIRRRGYGTTKPRR